MCCRSWGDCWMSKLLDIFDDVTRLGTKIPTSEYQKYGEYPIFDQGQEYISGYTCEKEGIYENVPAIIFGDHTRVLKYVDMPCFLGADGVKLLKAKRNDVNTKYLFYRLCAADIPNTGYNRHFKWLKEVEFMLPSFEEQKEISSNLDKVTHAIDLCNTILEKLDLLVKSQFVEMFGDPVINPKNWEKVYIGDVVTEVKYGTSRPAIDGGKYAYIRMNNLTYDGHLDLSDIKRIDIPDNEIEKCIVHKGDVLFNRTNSVELVGKTCVFNENEDMVIAGYIIRIRLKPYVLPLFLSSYMNTDVLKKRLREIAKGAVNQANINAQELKAIDMYLPPLDLQNQFADFVKTIDKSKFDVQLLIKNIRRVKFYD